MDRKSVVITGIGPVTPIGIGVSNFWKACCEGRSGISPFRLSDNNHQPDIAVAGKIYDFNPADFLPKAKFKWMDRFAHIALVAASLALEDAGIDLQKENPSKIGVMCGSCLGGMLAAEEQLDILHTKGPKRVRPKLVPANTLNSAAGEIAIAFGLKGPNLSVSNSFVCGAEALGLAFDAFQLYDLDIMVVGGIDAPLGNLTIRSLLGSHYISKTSIRPFDLNRDGFVFSEGGAVLIMERLEHARQRGARLYAEYAGYGHTRSENSQDPQALLRAAQMALESAWLDPEDVDYIHAFGAATVQGDKLETQVIKNLLGKRAYRVPVSAVKSMIGHTFGGAAAIEIAVCALAIKTNMIVPTINYQTPDPACDLDYVPNTARESEVEVALVHAMGMTGDCVVTALKKAHD